jgi:hypothetical protein
LALRRSPQDVVVRVWSGIKSIKLSASSVPVLLVDPQLDFRSPLYLALLFYHRTLRRLVAVELKLGRFSAMLNEWRQLCC